jgi:N utilization substance protein B
VDDLAARGPWRGGELTMTRRSRGREVALQVLYQIEQNTGMPVSEVHQFISRRLLGEPRLIEFTEDLIAGVRQHQPRIDDMIKEVAENWRLDRMAAIDRNILRLGAYEVLFCPDVPAKVAINEALELAKRYSTGQSSRFVNGILDRVLQLHAEPPPANLDDTVGQPSPEVDDRPQGAKDTSEDTAEAEPGP